MPGGFVSYWEIAPFHGARSRWVVGSAVCYNYDGQNFDYEASSLRITWHAIISADSMSGRWKSYGSAFWALALFKVLLLPQVLRIRRAGPANDISAIWLVAARMSIVIWLAYASLISSLAPFW